MARNRLNVKIKAFRAYESLAVIMNKLCLMMVATAICVSACGIKGPLYIPEKQYPPKSDGKAPAKVPTPKTPAGDDVYPN